MELMNSQQPNEICNFVYIFRTMVKEKESPIPSTSTAGMCKDDQEEEANVKHPFNSPKKEYYRLVDQGCLVSDMIYLGRILSAYRKETWKGDVFHDSMKLSSD